MSYSVGELAQLAGVTVRTLHHYDEIGLLTPMDRTRAGYRRYTPADAERLHRILVYRQLGFDLARIAEILDDPDTDAMQHLRRQHELLRSEQRRLDGVIRSVEALMNAKKTGIDLTPDEMREVFGSFDPGQHADEAEERWGGTEAYRESQRRAASYDKAKWLEIRDEADAIHRELAAALADGQPADGPAAMDLAERHRQHIGRWFYDCTVEIHAGLAEMYVADPRFAQTYETIAPGLSRYLRDAIQANAARAGIR
jgi:MerR family transcriptional regulator, thiopeptide resistance regulator